MKKKIVIFVSIIVAISILIILYIVFTRDNQSFGDYLDLEEVEDSTLFYNPDNADTMVRKTNNVLPELAPELMDLGIDKFTVEEKDISYSADTSTVTVIYPMDSYTQYLLIKFNEDGTMASHLFYTDMEAD